MRSFKLEILTPDGIELEGECESLLIRTDIGDVEILAGHTEYFAPIGVGRARIIMNGEKKLASVSGGFLSVSREMVSVVATTFEFSDDIDIERAIAAKERAEQLKASAKNDKEVLLAKAKLQRALSRISVAEAKRF